MYTIKQAGLRSGVSVPLLRAWERRYGIVAPTRTPSGYRLYDDAAVDRLRTMRRLVDEGWTASEAARAVIAGEVPPDRRDATPEEGPPDPAPSASPESSHTEQLIDRFVAAAARMDQAGIEATLDEAFAVGTFEHVAESVVLPALRALGDAWQQGTVDVAGEHAASQAVGRRLSSAFAAAGRPLPGSGIVVGLPPGSRHELGGLAFATAARRAGLPVLYLGADVPAASWVEAARAAEARGAVIAVPTNGDASAAASVLGALEELDGTFVRAVGGAGADGMSLPDGVVRLPPRVSEAATVLRRLIHETPRP